MEIDTGIVLEQASGVYEPAEDSYLLIESLMVEPGEKVLEIGSGTGIVSLHCAKAGAEVIATDISADAVRCTKRNSEYNSLSVNVLRSDLFDGIRGRFDLIIFNPPYLPADDSRDLRWSAGPTGREVIARFLAGAGKHLEPDGRIVLVLSSLTGLKELERLSESLGFHAKILGEKRLFFEIIYAVELRKG